MVTAPAPPFRVDLRYPAIRDALDAYTAAFDAWRLADTDARRAALFERWAQLETALMEHGAKAERGNDRRRADAARKLDVALGHAASAAWEVRAADDEARFLREGPAVFTRERSAELVAR